MKKQTKKEMIDKKIKKCTKAMKNIADGLTPCVEISDKHNAKYTERDFHKAMLMGLSMNTQAAGCATAASALANQLGLGRISTAEWVRRAICNVTEDEIYEQTGQTIARQLKRLRKLKLLKGKQGLTVAIDMHLIARFDKKYGDELVRSREKNGSHTFER